MPHRVGVVALQHESNTFIARKTALADFEGHLLLTAEAVREQLAHSHHEVGGFFGGLELEGIEAVPIFAARAMPYGTIEAHAADALVKSLFEALDRAGPLDGLLVAPHGAAVAEGEPDFDGFWLTRLRERFGTAFPIIGTLDLHANVSPRMIAACDALIAYRTNPHLDQRARGEAAAILMARTLRGEIRPTMAAAFPPLCVNIERQATAEPHWKPLLDLAERQRKLPGVLSNSLLYGFPYSDVPEMGAVTIAVTDGDPVLARECADGLADLWWGSRHDFVGQLIGVEEALLLAAALDGPICLLDMGDNIGGGSAADGTTLIHALRDSGLSPALAAICDPSAVKLAETAGVGARLKLTVGGRSDSLHGPPFTAEFTVLRIGAGTFGEPDARHGGIVAFDHGRTAVVRTDSGLTLLFNSIRTAPFSLNQLASAGIDPAAFRIIVAKGVHAPVAAYAPVCRHLIRVDTPGVTAADLGRFEYRNRRRPMFPLEESATYNGG